MIPGWLRKLLGLVKEPPRHGAWAWDSQTRLVDDRGRVAGKIIMAGENTFWAFWNDDNFGTYVTAGHAKAAVEQRARRYRDIDFASIPHTAPETK